MKWTTSFILLTYSISICAHNPQKQQHNIYTTDVEVEYILCENVHGQLYYYSKLSNDKNKISCLKNIAKARYINNINKTGWAYIEVETADHKIPHNIQSYAAGFIEGRATRDVINLHIRNTIDGFCNNAEKFCNDLNEYLLRNYLWMQDKIDKNPKSNYWIQVNMTLNQLIGMIDGYDNTLGRRLGSEEIIAHPIYLIQLAGDIEGLATKFKRPDTVRGLLAGKGHCSALVKILPDFSDILFSHVTWTSYSSMLRIQKKYTFRTGDHSYSFSSYPGSISSIDDFILTSAQLAIFETTLSVYNDDLLKFITTHSVLCWIRTQVAHRTSSSGLAWARTFAKHKSGTYNNQWVVVDYKKLQRNRKHQDSGLIHVLEEMPGNVMHSDMTVVLMNSSYWPSYNSPFFPVIFNWSGTPKMVKKFGDWYSYDRTPRALIFKRDHEKVIDMDSMINLMRSNNYTADPLSRCNCDPPYSAENAISCRSDLNPINGTYPFPSLGYRDHGATDLKVTNSHLIDSLSFTAIAGPTHNPTPVFDWNTSLLRDIVPHYGQPVRWIFPPVTHKWSTVSLYSPKATHDLVYDIF